ncbi:MAG: hypothetical protein UMV23_04735 [Halanaerobium sp.]|nr:hypothetical protein [Halanaerobium sp.]
MKDKELDIKILNSFTEAYYNLFRQEIIDREQLEKVLDLLNELELLPGRFLERQLENIFPGD